MRSTLSLVIFLSACVLRPYDDQASATAATATAASASTTSTSASTASTSTSTSGSTATPTTTDSSDATSVGTTRGDATPDLGRVHCDLWLEDCPEGQKCMPYAHDWSPSWNDHKCVPIAPDPDRVDEPCTLLGNGLDGLDSCEKHAMCWNVSAETRQGTCVAMCIGSVDAPACEVPGITCLDNWVLILCLPPCDPLAQDCANGDLCISLAKGEPFACVLDASGDAGQLFDPCDAPHKCDAGLVCAAPTDALECDSRAAGCCLPYCDLDEPNTCPGQGQQCIPWYDDPDDAPAYNLDVGTCAVPPP